jgi:hypothetical protein
MRLGRVLFDPIPEKHDSQNVACVASNLVVRIERQLDAVQTASAATHYSQNHDFADARTLIPIGSCHQFPIHRVALHTPSWDYHVVAGRTSNRTRDNHDDHLVVPRRA